MGESTNPRGKLRFDRRIRLEFHGATITSDAGLLACRELDDALGLTETASECLQESRGGRNVQHRLVGLLRQSVYSRLAGYEDTNDAERLAQDPTMRIIVGRRDTDRSAASTNTMSRFETEVLTQDGNVEGLDRLNAEWVDGAMSRTPHRRVILDMDSSESPVHGEQEGASYNGHFGSTCYHPLFVFNQFGDCEGAMLRAGNVHSAHRWRDVLDPVLSRYGATGVRRYFRADAAFAKPDIYEYLEERRVFYAIRLPSNKVLQYEIAPLLMRPVGRPPKRPVILYDDFFRAMAQARVDHSTDKTFRSFLAPDLLILDDLGLHRMTQQQSIDLYELVIARHRTASFVITSNRAVDEWLGLFDDPILGNSALDRLANASYQIVIEGASYRERLSPHRALLDRKEVVDPQT